MTEKPYSIAQLRNLWEDPQVTTQEIADIMGCTRLTIRKRAVAHQLGDKAYIPKNSKIDPELLRAFWDAGISTAKIAEHFGCHDASVSRAVRELDLKRRPHGNVGKNTPYTIKQVLEAREAGAKLKYEES